MTKTITIESKIERKLTGSHYTPRILADFVATQILTYYIQAQKLKGISILDPAVGDGELLIALVKALKEAGYESLRICSFDTNEEALQLAERRIANSISSATLDFTCDDFLEHVTEHYPINGDDLFLNKSSKKYDLIISNPPYVRTQHLGAIKAQKIARDFNLNGRIDLYHPFICGISSVLKSGGIAGIIVSNRFMTTKSGMTLRRKISQDFDILHIWDMGDTRFFEAAVLPAVLVLRKKEDKKETSVKTHFSTIYSCKEQSTHEIADDTISALGKEGVIKIREKYYLVKHGELECDDILDGVWRISDNNTKKWLNKVEQNTHCTFSDIGQIKVGVKTTADKVFIRKDWKVCDDGKKPELLKPLITHHISRRYKSTDIEKEILYPHQIINGKRLAANLSKYPRAAAYLNKHRDELEKRQYLIDAGRKWYEIWVPHDPSLWKSPKVVFRDIAESPTFWIDMTGAVVNGDCYWFTCEKEKNSDLLWLAMAIGNSKFIEFYYDSMYNNKLYANRRRFMTQYVKNFPIPNPKLDITKRIMGLSKEVYKLIPSDKATELMNEIDELVWQAFGLCSKEVLR